MVDIAIAALDSVEFDGRFLVVRFLLTDGSVAATHWPRERLEACLARLGKLCATGHETSHSSRNG